LRTPEEIGPAFSAVSRAHAEALYIIPDAFFFTHRRTLLDLVSKARLPTIYWERDLADEGGLMSYGSNNGEIMRRSAGYVE
jgi:putative ABC transport system substrate-binding protein